LLTLTPSLPVGDADLTVKFNCEEGEGNTFSWNETNPKCHILSLKGGYEYTIRGGGKGTLNLTVIASSETPGKQSLVAHVQQNLVLQGNSSQNTSKSTIE